MSVIIAVSKYNTLSLVVQMPSLLEKKRKCDLGSEFYYYIISKLCFKHLITSLSL